MRGDFLYMAMSLDELWRALGNRGDRPVGWFGPGGSPENPVTSVEQARSSQALAEQQQAREAFTTRQRGEEEEFLGRFRTEYPGILTGVEEQLRLPELRTAAFGATQRLEALPEEIEAASMGRDISAGQLGRITAARQAEQLPEVQDLLSNLQFAESEFGRRSERALTPFTTEAQFLTDRWARDSTGFNQDSENRLNFLINQLKIGADLTISERTQATELARLEAAKLEAERAVITQDAGDRILILGPGGNLITQYPKGRLPSAGTSGQLDLVSLYQEYQRQQGK